VDNIAREYALEALANPDAENRYLIAHGFVSVRRRATRCGCSRVSIAGNYCAYTDLQTNRMLATLRSTPEFTQLLFAAKQCRNDFLSETVQAAHRIAVLESMPLPAEDILPE